MHRVEETSDITVASLKSYPAEQVRAGIPAESRDDARAILSRLRGLATVCPTPSPSPSPSPTRTRSASGGKTTSKHKAGAKASRSPSKAPSPTRSPSPSPSPTIAPPDCIETGS
jgi:hypothetical protein